MKQGDSQVLDLWRLNSRDHRDFCVSNQSLTNARKAPYLLYSISSKIKKLKKN